MSKEECIAVLIVPRNGRSTDDARTIKEATVLPIDQTLMMELPELPYGSVWLVAAGDGEPGHLSPLAMHALGTADAAIHDPGSQVRSSIS